MKINKGRLLMLAAAMVSTAIVVMGLAPNVYVAAVGAFFTGLSSAMFMTSIGTLMQASVDETMRGRVSSVFQLTLQLFAVGMLLGGLFTAWIGPNETLLPFGGLIGAVSILIFVKSPELRNAS